MQDGDSPLNHWVKDNAPTANIVSIVLLVFAAWAALEILTNVAGTEIPPETGMETNSDPDDTQRNNNGYIVGIGAIAFTVGVVIQLLIPRGIIEEEIEDTKITFNEDLVRLTKWLCGRGTTTSQFFDWADVDDSGTIDMVEFADALRTAEIANLPPWEIEELVKLMDINSDGKINLPEFDIMILNIQNTLGIEFVPFVEETVEEEHEEVTEVEAEEVVEAPEETAEIDEEASGANGEEITDDVVESGEDTTEEENDHQDIEDEEVAEDDSVEQGPTEETEEVQEETEEQIEDAEESIEQLPESESDHQEEEVEQVTEAEETVALDAPAVEDVPAIEEIPAIEEAPAIDETEDVEAADIPAAEEIPAVEEAPAIEENHEDESEDAIVDEAANEEDAVVEDVAEEAPQVEEPVEDETPKKKRKF